MDIVGKIGVASVMSRKIIEGYQTPPEGCSLYVYSVTDVVGQ
jgi:hypothetical protein